MARISKPEPERTYVAKTRRCLMCLDPFESSWEGERVCRRCKGTNGWLDGTGTPLEYEVVRRREIES